MRVLHCFFQYLPETMNWAYKLLNQDESSKVLIASPLVVRNRFYRPDFTYVLSPFQWQFPEKEWALNKGQKILASITKPIYWRYAAWKLRKNPPQLIHAHFASTACDAMPLARLLNRPMVVSFYGFDYEKLPNTRPRYRSLYQKLFVEAALFLCEGPHGAQKLREMGCPSGKIQVLRLGRLIPDAAIIPKRKEAGSLQLLQAATFVEKKGHTYTLQAFKRALLECPGLKLTLVGETVDVHIKSEVLSYIKNEGLESCVRVLDFVEQADFVAFLAQFDVLIQPSTYAADGDCEGGAPVVLLDAQLAGLPVIATRHCDILDVVQEGRSAVLTDERDIEALAGAIVRFYRMDGSEFESFSRAGQEHVREGFDVRESRRKLRSLYGDLSSA